MTKEFACSVLFAKSIFRIDVSCVFVTLVSRCRRNKCHATRNKCHAISNRCLTSSNRCHAIRNKCLTTSNRCLTIRNIPVEAKQLRSSIRMTSQDIELCVRL